MVKIKYAGHIKQLQLAVGVVNSLLTDYKFYQRISGHSLFDMADITPGQVSDLIKDANFSMNIDFYYSILPLSPAITYDDILEPQTIWLNKWNIDRPIDSLCNVLMHQCVHAVNAINPEFNFGHGNNSYEGKLNTAPYWIAGLAQRMFLNDDSQPCDHVIHEELYNIPKVVLQHC